MDNQVKSKERVQQHGEVFTAEREVNAMLDLVKEETERIDSRFLEPACGDGNFLVEIIRRKLAIPFNHAQHKRYTQMQYEHDAIVCATSIYGIDILEDNVERCRERLLEIFVEQYKQLYKKKINLNVIETIRFILSKNIIHGDALTYKRIDKPDEWIIITEWSTLGRGQINRRDYEFQYLVGDNALQMGYNDLPCKQFAPQNIYNLNKEIYGE